MMSTVMLETCRDEVNTGTWKSVTSWLLARNSCANWYIYIYTHTHTRARACMNTILYFCPQAVYRHTEHTRNTQYTYCSHAQTISATTFVRDLCSSLSFTKGLQKVLSACNIKSCILPYQQFLVQHYGKCPHVNTFIIQHCVLFMFGTYSFTLFQDLYNKVNRARTRSHLYTLCIPTCSTWYTNFNTQWNLSKWFNLMKQHNLP